MSTQPFTVPTDCCGTHHPWLVACASRGAMPKQRMTTADVVAEVACIRQTCLGMRVANIYDLDSKVRSPPACCNACQMRPSCGLKLSRRCASQRRLASMWGPVPMACVSLHVQTYLLKLQRSGEDGYKTFLLMESGQRFHTTQVCTSDCVPSRSPSCSAVDNLGISAVSPCSVREGTSPWLATPLTGISVGHVGASMVFAWHSWD